MKKQYLSPEFEWLPLNENDVVLSSEFKPGNGNNDGDDPWGGKQGNSRSNDIFMV